MQKTIFLDTHIWSYLVKCDHYSESQLLKARERLINSARGGEFEVVCSLTVLQEIIGVYRNDPNKYDAIKNLVFTTVGNRWLMEIKARYMAELFNGGILKPTSRYIARDERRQIERLASTKKDVLDIGNITHDEKVAFQAGQEDAKSKIFTDLGSAGGKPPKGIAKDYDRWFTDGRDHEGWVMRVLEGGVTRKLFSADKIKDFKPSYENSPSIWQYVDFRQAKILLNLGHAIAIKDSDAIDADIYGCSPYYNVLVTEDKRFKETIGLIANNRFEIYSFKQLMSTLLS